MKNNLKIIISVTLLCMLQVTISCDDNGNDKKLCLEAPCGTVIADSMNITLLIQGNVDLSVAGIVIDEEETLLSLEGWDYNENKLYTCWQTIPTISKNSSVIFIHEINGEPIVTALNVTGISGNQVVIEIEGEDAKIENYEDCDDTP